MFVPSCPLDLPFLGLSFKHTHPLPFRNGTHGNCRPSSSTSSQLFIYGRVLSPLPGLEPDGNCL